VVNGASPFTATSTGATPLHLAAGAGSHELSMEIVERLAHRAAPQGGGGWRESLEQTDNEGKLCQRLFPSIGKVTNNDCGCGFVCR
jgi:hypothetical protein